MQDFLFLGRSNQGAAVTSHDLQQNALYIIYVFNCRCNCTTPGSLPFTDLTMQIKFKSCRGGPGSAVALVGRWRYSVSIRARCQARSSCATRCSALAAQSAYLSGECHRRSPSADQQLRLISHERWRKRRCAVPPSVCGASGAAAAAAVAAAAPISAFALCSTAAQTEWMFRLGTLYALPFFLLVSYFQLNAHIAADMEHR